MEGRGPIHFRDLTPRDFYFIQILRNEKVPDNTLVLSLFHRLLLDEGTLDQFTISETRKIVGWAMENLLEAKIMSVEEWLKTAFHLGKQRWDSSVDWMETLPVPKILLMIDILNDHVKAQEAEMKKAGRKK